LDLPTEAEQAEKPAAMWADSKATGGRFTIECATAGETVQESGKVLTCQMLPKV
jgi:hypothetical protein